MGSINVEIGGPARSAQGLVCGLERLGVETTLLSFLPGDRPWYQGVRRFVAAERRGYGGMREVIARAFDQARPEVVHSNGLWMPCIHMTIREAVRRGIPVIHAPRGSCEPLAMQDKKWKKRLAWWTYVRRDLRSVDAFHVTSAEEAAHMRQLGFSQPIHVVPNAVELPEQDQGQWGRGKKEGDKRVVLYLGRIHVHKGLRELIAAWAQAANAGWTNGWELWLVGPDFGCKTELEALVQTLGIGAAVRFLDAVSDAEKWGVYAQADLFAMPSYSENFGLSIAESLYAGVPVIATNTTPWAELVEERCGWWIGLGVDPIVTALREAVGLSDEARELMGRRGRALVERKYIWDAIALQMRAVYESVLGIPWA